MPSRGLAIALRLSVAALVVSGYVALVTTPEYGFPLLLVPALLLLFAPVGEWLDARYPAYSKVMSLLAVVYTVALVPYTLRAGLLPGVVLLVAFVQAHKLLHRKTPRDYPQVFLMAFFLLLCACAQDPNSAIGPTMVLFALSATWAFVALQVTRESAAIADRSQQAHGGTPLAEVVSLDEDWGDGTVLRPKLGSRTLFSYVFALSVCCVGLAFGVFLVTPRTEAGFIGPHDLSWATTGISSRPEVGREQRIERDVSPVMLVEFPEERDGRYMGSLYWRVSSFDHFNGRQWDCLGISQHFNDATAGLSFTRPAIDRVTRTPHPAQPRTVVQRFYITAPTKEGLPALPHVLEARAEGAELAWDPRLDYTFRDLTGSGALEYEVTSEVWRRDPNALREARVDYAEVLPQHDYQLLTRHGLRRSTTRLTRRITDDAPTVYDKVRAVERWFSEGDFTYSLEVPALDARGAIDDFVQNEQTGHCQLFATAMALMVRSLGIPARVVSGYQGGEWRQGDRAYLVRQEMAHLWVEVYFIDIGWVTFDPSPPPESLVEGTLSGLSRATKRFILDARMIWYRDVIGYRGRIRWTQLSRLIRGLLQFDFSVLVAPMGTQTPTPGTWRVPATVLTIMMAFAFAAFGLRTRKRSGSGHEQLTRDQVRARRLIGQLKSRLRSLGLDCRGMTAGEVLEEVLQRRVASGDEVAEILALYNRVRFGQAPLAAPGLRNWLKRARRLTRLKTDAQGAHSS